MKRRWHIRTRILVTLIGLTCVILLAVALAFNLSVRSYIRSRVSAQLHSVSESASGIDSISRRSASVMPLCTSAE